MLTRLRISNFKLFESIDIELGSPVVLIGPNNSGKTTALQALALWDVGLRTWNAKRSGKASPEKRPGVTLNRRDLTQIPVPSANLLWRSTEVRKGKKANGGSKTENIRISVSVDGLKGGVPWTCGLEFDYSNEESFFCRPLRLPHFEHHKIEESKFSEVPEAASEVRIAFLPPMSGLSATEPKWEIGRINVLIGEGQTAQVIRNLCHHVFEMEGSRTHWDDLCKRIHSLFGVTLLPPEYVVERGEITMQYKDPDGTRLDLSSSGRGLLQTVLLLAHLHANPRTVLLLDEPDAHLEILRQRQIFRTIAELVDQQESQVIAASHSEVVLNEAAARGKVITFVDNPHTMNDRGSQVIKALTEIGWDQYYQAELTGWILYLEGPTDLAILQAFARTLGHPALPHLERPFVHYVTTNLPKRARDHFFGLREGKQDLLGIAIFDRVTDELQSTSPLHETMWVRREIENYFCTEATLLKYAQGKPTSDLFDIADQGKRSAVMNECIAEISTAMRTLGKPDIWSADVKASDEVLTPLMDLFSRKLKLPLQLRKSEYHQLAALVPREAIDADIRAKLDIINATVKRAKPAFR